MNCVMVIGNLATDPEVKTVGGDMTVGKFLLAISRVPSKRGETTKPDFVRVVTWSKQAQNAGRYLHKGSRIGVIGRVRGEFYEPEGGQARLNTEIIADRIEYLSPPPSAATPSRRK